MLVLVCLAIFGVFTLNPVQAETYTATDLAVTLDNYAPSATTNYDFSFTLPADISTNGSLWIYFPYVYSGADYSYADATNATVTSDQFTLNYAMSSSVSLMPASNLTSGSTVSFSINNVINPSIESSGSITVSGDDYSSGMYFTGTDNINYDDPNTIDDLTITVTDPVIGAMESVMVYLNYYDVNNPSNYEYYYQTTNSEGEVAFNGLTVNRTYSISFSYSGVETTNTPPAATTILYNSEGQAASYNFIVPNIITSVLDADGNPLAYASWYIYETDPIYQWLTSGTTSAAGLISAGITAPTSGTNTYQLYVTNNTTYDTLTNEFTINSSGTVSGLASTIQFAAPNVTGRILADGVPVSGVYVYLNSADYSSGTYFSDYAMSDINGNINFTATAAGTYYFYVNTYGINGYSAPDMQTITITDPSTTTALGDISLIENTKTITGQVTKTDGSVVTDASVYAYNSNGGYAYTNTDNNGEYTLTMTGGSWNLSVYPMTYPATWAYTEKQIVKKFAKNSTVESATADIQVEEYTSTISGRVIYPNGTPIGADEAYISVSSNNVYASAATDANGEFTMNTTGGVFSFWLYANSESYGAPTVNPITVKSNEDVNIGDIQLLEKSATIEGTVALNSGSPLENIEVYAWKNGTWDWGSTTSDSNGAYSMAVTSGTWQAYTWSGGSGTAMGGEDDGLSYTYLGGPKTVITAEDERSVGNDFIYAVNDSSVVITTKNNDETITSESGWVSLTSTSTTNSSGEWYGSLGCYLYNGSCSLDLPAGDYNAQYYSYSNWGAGTDSTSYTFTGLQVNGESVNYITAETGQTGVVDLIMTPNDVTVSGSFVDQDNNAISDIPYGEIYATNGTGGFAYVWIELDGSYSLDLCAGTWYLNYWVDPTSGYIPSGTGNATITVDSGDEITQNFTLLQLDSTINVTTYDPDGNMLPNVFIDVNTRYGQSETVTAAEYGLIDQSTYTNEGGIGSVVMPAGTYYVTVSLPVSEGYINPEPQTVTVDAENSADLSFTFLTSDATLSGTVTDGVGITMNKIRTLAVGDAVSDAFVYAYSDKGFYTEGESDANGQFTLNVLQGDNWHVGGIKEGIGYYYYSDQSVMAVDEAAEDGDLSLDNSAVLPDAQTVIFQSNEPQVITLSDGTIINIPAYAISSQDQQLTVTATPKAQIARTANTQPITYAYDLVALDLNNSVISQFASSVTISIPYDESDLPEGMSEEDISPEYFASTAGNWSPITSYTVDTVNNLFVISIDHFSSFALTIGVKELDNIPVKITGVKVPDKYRKARQVKIKWTADKYAISYQVKLVGKAGKKIKLFNVDQNKKVIKSKYLHSNKAYKVKVRGVSANEEKGEWSKYKKFRTLPAKVKNLSISAITNSTATISYNKVSGNIKKYVISLYHDGELVSKYTNTDNSLLLEDLQSDTRYTVKIQAVYDKNNKSETSQKSFTTTDYYYKG